jgi:hypothetical protein
MVAVDGAGGPSLMSTSTCIVKKFAVFCENRTIIIVRIEGLLTAVTVSDTERFCCLEYHAI